MNRHSRRNFFTRVCRPAGFWLLAIALNHPAHAAISEGPLPASRLEAQQRRQQLFDQGVLSYQEKMRVGRERYDRQQAERAKIIHGMNAELEARQQAMQIEIAPRTPARITSLADGWFKPVLALFFAGLTLLCVYWIKRKCERAETAPGWLTCLPDTAAGSATDKSIPMPPSAPPSPTEK